MISAEDREVLDTVRAIGPLLARVEQLEPDEREYLGHVVESLWPAFSKICVEAVDHAVAVLRTAGFSLPPD